jgi:hypothetical protein
MRVMPPTLPRVVLGAQKGTAEPDECRTGVGMRPTTASFKNVPCGTPDFAAFIGRRGQTDALQNPPALPQPAMIQPVRQAVQRTLSAGSVTCVSQ